MQILRWMALSGRCHRCGWEGERCSGCNILKNKAFALELYEDGKETVDLVFLCEKCVDKAFEDQKDAVNIR